MMKKILANVSNECLFLMTTIPTLISIWAVYVIAYVDPPPSKGPLTFTEILFSIFTIVGGTIGFYLIAYRLYSKTKNHAGAMIWIDGNDLYILGEQFAPISQINFAASGRDFYRLVFETVDGKRKVIPLGQIKGGLFGDIDKMIIAPLKNRLQNETNL